MPEPFKNIFNRGFIESLSTEIKKRYASFDDAGFVDKIFSADWPARELKDRMAYIAIMIDEFLDIDYAQSLEVLKRVSDKFEGLVHLVFPTYVEMFGLQYYDESIVALEYFTQRSSSEFAVRPFIIKYPEQMIMQLVKWSESENHHLRRLASEGCRPRLPWAIALPEFKNDPTVIVPILEKLKDDPSEYVRRSVANNLNDISKDNPETLITIAQKWIGSNKQTDKLVKHACRTLLKKGNCEVLEIFGIKKPDHITIENLSIGNEVNIGSFITLNFILRTKEEKLGILRIEYGLDYRMKNGAFSRKIFKISETDCSDQVKIIVRKISFKPITTRTFYKGKHGLSIIINGTEMGYVEFELV